MRYNTVIFDLDGTLLDTLEDLKNSVNYVLSQYNYPTRTLEEIRNFIGNGVKVLLMRSFPEHTSMDEIEDALILQRDYYSSHMYDNTTLYSGINEMLTSLKQADYQLAIVSNKTDSAVKELNNRFFHKFIELAIGTRSDAKKPNPSCVFEAINTLKSIPETSIYVGDSEVDIETAHNAGIPCIGVSWGFRGREFLVAHGADYVIDFPTELPSLLKNI